MSVTSVNTSNGSGITATPSSGDVNINSLVAGLNGIVISGGTGKQSIISASDVDFNSVSLDSASGKTVKLIADSALANNNIYTLPPTLPSTTGQVLSSTTEGIMSWATGGGVTNPLSENLDANNKNIINIYNLSIADTGGLNTTSFIGGTQTDELIQYTLPSIAPITGQVLSSDGTGTMSWVPGTGTVTNPLSTNLNCNSLDLFNIDALVIEDASKAFSTSISGGTQTANIAYTLPSTAPTSTGQVLSSDTAGIMSWTTNALGVGDVTNPLTADLSGGGFNISAVNVLQSNEIDAIPASGQDSGKLTIVNSNTTPNNTTLVIATAQTTDITYTLPSALPSSTDQVLTSDTSGIMSWVTTSSLTPGGSFLNIAGSVSSQAGGYYGTISITNGFPAGTYLFNLNWFFNQSCVITANNSLVGGITYVDTIIPAYINVIPVIATNSDVYDSTVQIPSMFIIDVASGQNLYAIVGFRSTTGVQLTSNNVTVNVYWQKIA